MISDTQKEIFTREAAVRLVCHKQIPTIEDIEKGIKLLMANEVAKQLAYNVIDVVHEKIGNVLKDMIQESSDDEEEDSIKNVAHILGIDLK